MNNEALERIKAAPTAEPEDDWERQAIANAAVIDPADSVTLDEALTHITRPNGRVLLRIPRSLHQKLAEQAREEGVSMNQYLLYKLAQ
ncbi:hypothetical protein AGMMS49992_24140 [Clostridia bacterium]|nr:hypothetical protein AGMMS49992_24140 [Clostridia bacterium]